MQFKNIATGSVQTIKNNYYRMKNKFLRDFLSMLSTRIANLAISFLSSIFLARFLGPIGIGLNSRLINFPLMFTSFSEMGMRQSTIYFIGKGKLSQQRIANAIIIMWLASSIIGLIIYYLLADLQMNTVQGILIFWSAIYIPLSILRSYIGGFFIGNDLIGLFSKYDFINNVMVFLLTIFLVWPLNMGVLGVLISTQLGSLVILLISIYIFKKKINIKLRLHFNKKIISSLLQHGVLYGIALFLSANLRQIPIFFMNGRISDYSIGVYSTGYSFANILNYIFISMSPILFTRSARSKNPTENSLQSHLILRLLIPVLIIFGLTLNLLMEYIIPLFYGDKFIDSIQITNIMIWGVIFFNFFGILNMDMAGKGKPIIAIKALTPTFILCCILNYYGIEKLGILGAAISTTACLGIGAIHYLVLYSKEISISIGEVIRPRRSDWVFLYNTVKRNN